MPKKFYEVIVGNVGKVHEGHNKATAVLEFNLQKNHSKRGYGRAANEAVTMYCDGEVVNGYDYSPGDEPVRTKKPREIALVWKSVDRPGAIVKRVWRKGWPETEQVLAYNDFFRLEEFCKRFKIPFAMEKPE